VIAYLLDTNICIELIRGRSQRVLSQLRNCNVGEVAISSITLAELQYGVARSSDPARNVLALAQFCVSLERPPFDASAAEVYGGVRVALERIGKPIGPLDILIAAHALALDVTLVSNNEREFRRVRGLRLVNWMKPASP
jgi:tRNA(fMet)-specific endonuclease VapC